MRTNETLVGEAGGVWLATSTVMGHWDEGGDVDDAALAELAVLRDRIRE